jgi:hypothetical protein
LFVRDGDVANQYLQEFTARYCQYGGSDTIRVAVDAADVGIPPSFALDQNYPNPFNPETSISYEIPHFSQVSLSVVDLLGRTVAVLYDGPAEPGRYRLRLDGRMLASGIYLARLVAGSATLHRKMLLVR